ncbi:hypothetical protein D3C75_660640 [compost metagenome]
MDRYANSTRAQCTGQTVTVQSRHVEVGQHQGKRTLRPVAHGFIAITGDHGMAAELLELATQDRLVDRVVFGDKYLQLEPAWRRQTPVDLGGQCPPCRSRQRHHDRIQAMHPDLPMSLHLLRLHSAFAAGHHLRSTPRRHTLVQHKVEHHRARVGKRRRIVAVHAGLCATLLQPIAYRLCKLANAAANLHR